MRPDLSTPRRVHLVGVGGAGMSAIATVLASMGHQVSGSDLRSSAAFERLQALGMRVVVGHSAANIGDAELVALSSAIAATNPEVVAAVAAGLPVLHRADVLAAITDNRKTVSVAGTHGKTTTSSMLALALVEAGMRPSFIIGGDLNEIGTGAVWSDGEWLVVEADESDGTFLELSTDAAIVTSVEPDHLEHYGSFEALVGSFDRFLHATDGPRVVCADDPQAAALAARTSAVTYGTSASAHYRIEGLASTRTSSSFRLTSEGRTVADIEVPIPGEHNARNAAAAATAALALGAPREAIERALARFAGVARRFQFRGTAADVTFVDDYAHLPGEVMPVLSAVRRGGWGRVVCVFQPHRYSRTAALWRDFANAFDDADLLVVTDVYGAGEPPRPGVSGQLVVDAVLEADPTRAVEYQPGRAELVAYLRATLQPGDVCLTLGAGDITSLPDELQAAAPGAGWGSNGSGSDGSGSDGSGSTAGSGGGDDA